MSDQLPRRFHLQRDTDITGVSGTGRVANGVLWPDGTVAIRWCGDRPSTVHWDRIADAEHVHGHHGSTRIVWDDEDPAPAVALLKQAENYLSALHGSVARHDNLAANLGCAGCQLRDAMRTALFTDGA
jgi:hypothetical protein